jgi:hypothetical protein
MLALLGLLPVGLNANRASTSETEAANIAAAINSDLRLSAALNRTSTLTATKVFQFPVPFTGMHTQFFGDGERASGSIDQNATASTTPAPRYRATVFFNTPSGRNATVGRILVTWPGLADPTAGSVPTAYSGAFEAITAIDTN